MSRKVWTALEEATAATLNAMVDRGFIDDATANRPTTGLRDGMVFQDTTLQQVQVYNSAMGSWVPWTAWGTAGRIGGDWTISPGTAAAGTTWLSMVSATFDSHGFIAEHATTGTAFIIPAGASVYLPGLYHVDVWVDVAADTDDWALGCLVRRSGQTRRYFIAGSENALTPPTEERATMFTVRLPAVGDEFALWLEGDFAGGPKSYTGEMSVRRHGGVL